ncbi:hypothetical protein SSS_08913, partial [Sarcoptes scabiei]
FQVRTNMQNSRTLLDCDQIFKHNIARYRDVCFDSPNISASSFESSNASDAEFLGPTYVRLPYFSDNSISINNISERIFLYQSYGRLMDVINLTRSFDQITNRSVEKIDSLKRYSIKIIALIEREFYCPEDHSFQFFETNQITPNLYCIFDASALRASVIIDCSSEHHNYRFTAAILSCEYTNFNVFQKVRLESISVDGGNVSSIESSQWLRIHYSDSQVEKSQSPFSVICVRPLFGNINVANVLEFIYFYKTNGFRRIIFYHYETSQISENQSYLNAGKFLKILESILGVELRRFKLNEELYLNVHAGGQLATINDCLYRFPHSVQLHIDIDEFLFVQSDSNQSLMNSIDRWLKSATSYVALYIQSVMHCHEFNYAHSNYYEFVQMRKFIADCHLNAFERLKFKNKMLEYFNQTDQRYESLLLVPGSKFCQKTVWTHLIRSKVILLRPLFVKQMGIHQVYQYETSSATKLITEDSDYVGDRIWHRIAPENLLRLSQLISSTINNWVLKILSLGISK